ncbi:MULTISPECIES: type II toxin-antitoxin system CcdA family antitoxin [unclassified Sphingomonas]|uniref:type II toxin-antitoxin system CcdA family antitoxin n=1 Tax=unclassified Sphingomonas TaxID=196159 RepID=UPI000BD08043|nr:MAG: hypothetical protein B7Z43_00245 [Sphingomonas sp. 12-62-6]OYX37832.1 MAG: hypothetical protein B7Y98_10935 [Sphingomonas sp. 32-62-10]OYY63783.1 MAG: hypothetical protein B7Y49_11905 [Sphingomonas sp. 28-62-11]
MPIANPPRQPVTFQADKRAVELAVELGVDVQSVCEQALRVEVARRFQEDNRKVMEAWNVWIEQNGLPLERYRLF